MDQKDFGGNKYRVKSIKHHAIIVVFLSIALVLCVIYEKDIDSFLGQSADSISESDTNTQPPYAEGSSVNTFDTEFGFQRRSSSTESESFPASMLITNTVTQEPDIESTPEPVSEPISTPEATPEPTQIAEPTLSPVPTPAPAPTPAPTPKSTATPDPIPSLDLFACLGHYEDNKGNYMEIRLDTSFNRARYTMQFYYNGGRYRIKG